MDEDNVKLQIVSFNVESESNYCSIINNDTSCTYSGTALVRRGSGVSLMRTIEESMELLFSMMLQARYEANLIVCVCVCVCVCV